MNVPATNDHDTAAFSVRCPGVLELPDRNIQFFNLEEDEDGWLVMVALADDEVVELRAGAVTRLGSVELVIDRLDDVTTTEFPIVGHLRPATA